MMVDDGKIKVWDIEFGFCIVMFIEYISGIIVCEFVKKGNVFFIVSLDGFIRVWDLIRYRNFRMFIVFERLFFFCMVVDLSGEVVVVGFIDFFDIYIWFVQIGQFLDRFIGYEGLVFLFVFVFNGGFLVSGSWDKMVRIWFIFN